MSNDKVAFNFESQENNIINFTPRIVYKGATTNLYRASDIFKTYSQFFPEQTFSEFHAGIQKLSNYALFPAPNPSNSILCNKKNVDKKLIYSILNVKEPQFQLASSSESNSSPVKRQNDSIHSSAGEKNRDSLQPTKRCVYDDLGSSDDEILAPLPPKKFKTPLEFAGRAPPPSISSAKQTYEDIKRKICETFTDEYAVPTSSFGAAICKKHKVMFDYKTAECKIPKHKHGSLTKYLQCFKDILEIKMIGQSYVFCINEHIKELIKKRKQAYFVPGSNPDSRYFLEAVFTTIFPVRITVPLNDFIGIVNYIYQCNIDSLTGGLSNFLQVLNSPNCYLLRSSCGFSLNVVPLHDSEYKEWANPSIHKKIMAIENKILNGQVFGDELGAIKVNVESKKIFGATGVDNLMKIADLNIPKYIQEISADKIPKNYDFKPVWMYLRHSVNFDDEKAFYCI